MTLPPETLFAMAGFALATSATPGPVNVVCAMTGALAGTRHALPFVTGATFCFVALLFALGGGLLAGTGWIDRLALPMTLAGAGYLLWMAWHLARDDGVPGSAEGAGLPGFWSGVAVQGLNPKAWLVTVSAVSTFVLPLPNRGAGLVAFAAIFAIVCWGSLATWAWIGTLVPPSLVRVFNRAMALALALSVAWMVRNALR